jgi:hypothetical protein
MLARLALAPTEAQAIAAACEAITRDFADLAAYAAGLPPADEEPPATPREDVAAPAPTAEVEGILRAAPRVDASRAVLVPKGLP